MHRQLVWTSGGANYLGAAGHCFLPAGETATHGAGADNYDASGVKVEACVAGCDGNFRTMGLAGTGKLLGKVAYARQQENASGEQGLLDDAEQVGFDAAPVREVVPHESSNSANKDDGLHRAPRSSHERPDRRFARQPVERMRTIQSPE